MPGHVLLTYRELVGERLDRGVAVRGQVFDDPNAKGLPENAQASSDRLDQRLGNRLGLRPIPCILPSQLEISYQARNRFSSRTVQNSREGGSPF